MHISVNDAKLCAITVFKIKIFKVKSDIILTNELTIYVLSSFRYRHDEPAVLYRTTFQLYLINQYVYLPSCQLSGLFV